MAQKAKQSLLSRLRVLCLGMKPINPRQLPERNQTAFALYSVSSFSYRWFVMLMIFWFMTEIFRPYGLEAFAYIIIAISLFGMIVVPFYKMVKFFLHPGRSREVKRSRLYLTTAALGLLVAFVCLMGWVCPGATLAREDYTSDTRSGEGDPGDGVEYGGGSGPILAGENSKEFNAIFGVKEAPVRIHIEIWFDGGVPLLFWIEINPDHELEDRGQR